MTTDTDPVYHCYENESFTYMDEHGVERFKSGLGKVIREYKTNFVGEPVRNWNTNTEERAHRANAQVEPERQNKGNNE